MISKEILKKLDEVIEDVRRAYLRGTAWDAREGMDFSIFYNVEEETLFWDRQPRGGQTGDYCSDTNVIEIWRKKADNCLEDNFDLMDSMDKYADEHGMTYDELKAACDTDEDLAEEVNNYHEEQSREWLEDEVESGAEEWLLDYSEIYDECKARIIEIEIKWAAECFVSKLKDYPDGSFTVVAIHTAREVREGFNPDDHDFYGSDLNLGLECALEELIESAEYGDTIQLIDSYGDYIALEDVPEETPGAFYAAGRYWTVITDINDHYLPRTIVDNKEV